MKVALRVSPGARTDAVGGRWDGPRGPALVVRVRARAVEGAANVAVIAAVAEAFGVKRGAVALVTGALGRDKIVVVEGDEAALAARRTVLLAM